LSNTVKIWGNDFDGSSDIDGDITINGSIIASDSQLIDLGLTSGTLWMDRNVGASSPEDAGLYFAWGETTGYTADEVGKTKQFSWDDYKYGNSLTKYNKTDGLTTLETTDDAVLQNVHKYSMPTKEQIVELIKETDVYCIKADGTEVHGTYQEGTGAGGRMIAWDSEIGDDEQLNGIEFRKKTDNSIKVFVPCAGNGYEGSMYDVGLSCFLWASSLNGDGPYDAWSLGFYYRGGYCVSGNGRCIGLPVRGVATPVEGSKTYTLPSSSGTLALDNVASTTSNGLMSSEDKTNLDDHLKNYDNPHKVTKNQINLGNVDNTSDS